jgi:hypothetical protein
MVNEECLFNVLRLSDPVPADGRIQCRLNQAGYIGKFQGSGKEFVYRDFVGSIEYGRSRPTRLECAARER